MSKIPIPTSKLPNTPSQSNPQKRRILSEVDENQLPESFKFKMTTGTNLPAPRYSTDSIKKLGKAPTTYKNTAAKKTSIPTPTFDHIQKLVGVSQNLNLTKRLSNGHGVYDDDSLTQRMNKVENNFSRDIENRISVINEFDKKISELTSQCEVIENEILDIKRNHKKCNHSLSDLNLELASKVKKSEQTENLILKNVGHKERLINIQIQESKNSLNRELDNLQSELAKELNLAKNYKDSQFIEELQALEGTEDKLKADLKEIRSDKIEQANLESKTLESQRKKYQGQQEETIQKLSSDHESKKREMENISRVLIDLTNELKKKIKDNDSINQNIIDLVDSKNNFDTITTNLNMKISNLGTEIESIEANSNELRSKRELARIVNSETRGKLDREMKLRRMMENAIMDYSGKLRVFVSLRKQGQLNIPYEISSDIDQETKDQITIYDKAFMFNKIFDVNYSTEEISQDFSPLIENSVIGSNASVVFLGNWLSNNDLIKTAIKTHLVNMEKRSQKYQARKWIFKYTLRAVSLDTENVTDVLSGKEIPNFHIDKTLDFDCSNVDITDLSDLDDDRIFTHQEVSSIILTVNACNNSNGKAFKSHVLYLNLSHFDPEVQFAAVQKSTHQHSSSSPSVTSPMHQLLKFCFQNTKNLNLFQVGIDDDNAKDFLTFAEYLNAINSNYKRK